MIQYNLGGITYMRNLLSTKDQRQLRLMEILIQNRNWLRLHVLAEKLGCTERILKNDLNELRTAFPNIDIQSSVNVFHTSVKF